MLLNRTVNKKILESIVHETFSNFGSIASSSLLDSLKLLGFYYATNAGISISIEDLKTPDVKRSFIKTANDETDYISQQWAQGFVSDSERFQSIIDSWNIATESLKNRIIEYYQKFDPANNLYIMAFSGARGNMSQVRQLVGMRGLMSDQEGKIIDLPIQANFREGLSSIDYIISSYGARKGIVDTALKTADSGYLTRRLIYIAQDLIIREIDCHTTEGVLIYLNENTNITNLVGRSLLSYRTRYSKYRNVYLDEDILTVKKLQQFQEDGQFLLNLRSSLTCTSNGSICQKCYGWDLATEKLISLGETVGIIAAQSIGEPGTQLTMRTFHTGGIFTSETLKQIVAPFSGKIIIPEDLKAIPYRTSHGKMVLKLQQETKLTILTWNGDSKQVALKIGSYLYINTSMFLKKGQLIAEYSSTSFLPGIRRLKPIYTFLAGEIKFENLQIRKPSKGKPIKVTEDSGILWIASGKIFPLPKEVHYSHPTILNSKKAFASLKIISPIEGYVEFIDGTISLKTRDQHIVLAIKSLMKKLPNCSVKISLRVKSHQFVDAHTILGSVDFYPNYNGFIYSVRKKPSKYTNTLFIITEEDVWKITSDQLNNFSFFEDKKVIVRSGQMINPTSKLNRSGFFLKRDGFKMIFQNATPVFLSPGAILNYKQGDFVLKNKILADLVNYTQQTEDIVQGLPKIEELIEARHPKVKADLARMPGIYLPSYNLTKTKQSQVVQTTVHLAKDILVVNVSSISSPTSKKVDVTKDKPIKKRIVSLTQSMPIRDGCKILGQKLFQHLPLPAGYRLIEKKDIEIIENRDIETVENKDIEKQPKKQKSKYKEGTLANSDHTVLSFEARVGKTKWSEQRLKTLINPNNSFISTDKEEFLHNYKTIYSYENTQLTPWVDIDQVQKVYRSPDGNLLLRIHSKLVYLKQLSTSTVKEYELPLNASLNFEPGNFIDIGEPITEGVVDIHDLLQILFNYHARRDGLAVGTLKSLHKFQLLLVNSIQAIYQSQGVNISSKHIEIIVRQMTGKVVIISSGDTNFLPGELIRLSLMNEIYKSVIMGANSNDEECPTREQLSRYQVPYYEPSIASATSVSLTKDGFLSSAGFQETKKVLTKAALEGTTDWLRNLKESIILGRIIPAGSSFLNYKNHLDSIYKFKN